jgi:hypothetical protein
MFIIFYNHYLSNFSKLKNQLPKLRFKINQLLESLLPNPIKEYNTTRSLKCNKKLLYKGKIYDHISLVKKRPKVPSTYPTLGYTPYMVNGHLIKPISLSGWSYGTCPSIICTHSIANVTHTFESSWSQNSMPKLLHQCCIVSFLVGMAKEG